MAIAAEQLTPGRLFKNSGLLFLFFSVFSMLCPAFWHESQLFVIQFFPVVCVASIQWEPAIEKSHWSKETMRYTYCSFSTDLSNSLFCNIHLRILNNLGEMNVSSESVHTKRSLLTFFQWIKWKLHLCFMLQSITSLCFLTFPTVAIFSISELIQMSVNPDRSLQCSWCCVTDCILLAHNKRLWKGASPLRSGNSHWVLYPKTIMIVLCFMPV